MLQDFREKVKIWARKLNRREDLFIAALIVLVGFGSFGLGRLSMLSLPNKQVNIENITLSQNTRGSITRTKGNIVASVSGSKYHLPWCPSANRIKEENKIWFTNAEEARAAGYTPAANCPGL